MKTPQHQTYKIRLIGYGKKNLAKNLILKSGNNSYSLNYRKKILLGNYFHAINELNCQSDLFIYKKKNYNFFTVLKRAISITLSSKKYFNGITNGFILYGSFKKTELSQLVSLLGINNSIHINKQASKIGLIGDNLDSDNEFEIRRNRKKREITILDSDITPIELSSFPNFNARRKFNSLIEKIISDKNLDAAFAVVRKLPDWHYLRSYFTLLFNIDNFDSKNTFRKARIVKSVNGFVYSPNELNEMMDWVNQDTNKNTQMATFSAANALVLNSTNVVLGEYFLPLVLEAESEKHTIPWPSNSWTTRNSDFVAVPNFESSEFIETGFLLRNFDNWAHFYEDVLPNMVFGLKSKNFKVLLINDVFDQTQEALIEIFCSRPINKLCTTTAYRIGNLSCTVVEYRRPLAISNNLQGLDMLDSATLLFMRDHLLNSDVLDLEFLEKPRIYIARRGGTFRKLANIREVEGILRKFDFELVYTEDLNVWEKISLFRQAKIVVAEYGAGLTNLWFSNVNTNLVQLTHYGVSKTEEFKPLVDLIGLKILKIKGSRSNIFEILQFGTDSYKVDLKELIRVLKDLSKN